MRAEKAEREAAEKREKEQESALKRALDTQIKRVAELEIRVEELTMLTEVRKLSSYYTLLLWFLTISLFMPTL